MSGLLEHHVCHEEPADSPQPTDANVGGLEGERLTECNNMETLEYRGIPERAGGSKLSRQPEIKHFFKIKKF